MPLMLAVRNKFIKFAAKIFTIMRNLILFLAVSFSFMTAHADYGTSGFIAADHPDIVFMGRNLVTPAHARAFNFPGATALVEFTGHSLDMYTSPGSGYFMVEVDAMEPYKVRFAEGDSIKTLAANLGDGNHSARITYAIEGFEMHPEIRGFRLADNGRLLKADRPEGPRIEFVGNSITCGYGTESTDSIVPFSYDTENHCLTYAYLTGRALDADVNVVARSGIGIYRNYDGPRSGSAEGTMPLEYGNTMLYDNTRPWDFSAFRPDIVCINLGTNDTSTGNYDIPIFEQRYSDFLDRVISLNSGSKIVLLTGSMLNGKKLEDVKAALDRLADSRKGVVYRFDMTPQTGELGYGASFHPSAAQSRKMASELTEFLKSIL